MKSLQVTAPYFPDDSKSLRALNVFLMNLRDKGVDAMDIQLLTFNPSEYKNRAIIVAWREE